MFTAELKINGCLIGVLYGTNQGLAPGKEDTYRYEYAYHAIDKSRVTVGKTVHKYNDGLEKLVGSILVKLREEVK